MRLLALREENGSKQTFDDAMKIINLMTIDVLTEVLRFKDKLVVRIESDDRTIEWTVNRG